MQNLYSGTCVMGLVVPMSQPRQSSDARDGAVTPPSPVMLAIAAATMHEQGRLFEPLPGTAPAADIGVRPQASYGGRSSVEISNPNLGPSDAELERRKRQPEEDGSKR